MSAFFKLIRLKRRGESRGFQSHVIKSSDATQTYRQLDCCGFQLATSGVLPLSLVENLRLSADLPWVAGEVFQTAGELLRVWYHQHLAHGSQLTGLGFEKALPGLLTIEAEQVFEFW